MQKTEVRRLILQTEHLGQVATLPTSLDWSDVVGSTEAGSQVKIAVARTTDSTGRSTIAKSTNNGTAWARVDVGVTADWASCAYGAGKFVIIQGGGNKAMYSTDDASSWTEVALPSSQEWNKVVYGNDRFVAICEKDDSTACPTAVSFDGITWYAGSMETGNGEILHTIKDYLYHLIPYQIL